VRKLLELINIFLYDRNAGKNAGYIWLHTFVSDTVTELY